jgi:hypothetical protein
MKLRLWSIMATMLLLAVPAWGQFSSAIEGIATDTNRAVLANATIKLSSLQSGTTLETRTTDSGYYRFSSLAPGEYEVSVDAPGFQKKSIKVTLSTRQNLDVPFILDVRNTEETVQITSDIPTLNTSETRMELTLKQSKVRDLPLLNNSIFALLSLAPGVTGTNGASDNFNPEYFSGISANGRSAAGNTYNVDGLSVTSNITYGTSNLGLNPEAVQEVTIETNSFKAEQGIGSSIVVSYTTKGGTNQFHGAGNYWYTNQDMRARTSLPFVQKYAPFARQNVSGAFGGPIIKNKTFFFAAIEMLRSKDSLVSVETYEAPEFVDWARQNFPNSTGTKFLTQAPIKGPVQTNILRRASDVLGATNCGTAASSNIPCALPMIVQGTWSRSPYRNGLQYSIRGDHNFRGGNDRINASYVRTESENANILSRPFQNSRSDRYVNAYQVSWVHTFSPSLLNEFGFSGNRVYGENNIGSPWQIPSTTITGTTGIGVGGGGPFVQNNYNWRNVVTWVKGAHTLKLGGTVYTGDDYAIFNPSNARPNFTFLNLLNFVSDQPFSGSLGAYDPKTGKPRDYQFGAALNTVSGFVQDEWKARPNLTLTMSLRWDDFGNPTGIKNFIYTNMFLSSGNTVDEQFSNASLKVVEKPFNGRLNKNFSPRLGMAWSPGGSSKMSIRGGIGLYYDWVTLGETVDRMNINPPNFLFPATGVNLPLKPIAYQAGSSAEFPYGFTRPTLPSTALDARGGYVGLQTNVGGVDPNLSPPKTLNYLIGVERQIWWNAVVGINYSGSKVWDSIVGTDFNRRAGDLLDGTLNRLNPSFGAMTYILNFNKSTYNAMIASLRRDFSARGTFQASYTLSRVTDLYQGGSRSVGFESAPDPRQLGDRPADALFDFRHRFSSSGVYRLPTPFGRNGFAKALLGGWEIGATGIAQTGAPFTVTHNAPFNPIRNAQGQVTGLNPNSGDFNADGFNFDFPNQQPNLPRKYERNNFLGSNSGKQVYTLAMFPIPVIGTQGNGQRAYFRQQGLISVNASLIKNNRLPILGESGNLQLKFEFFNVLNRVNLGGMINQLNNFNFGKILSQGDPRVVQIGARIAF